MSDREDRRPGAGTVSDPFDGSSTEKFDTLLRTRSERGVTNLTVCIGPGRFRTEGARDYEIGAGHQDKLHAGGFTVNRGWKVFGIGADRTTLQLSGLYTGSAKAGYLLARIINTHDLQSDDVEVADLTLDDNYPELKSRYKERLQLEAVVLRSNAGGHWIHDLHVINAAGESTESFPVEISSQANSPTASRGNVVERVTMDHWGAGKCTAIAIDNALAEVRFNSVSGYQNAYGGWKLSGVKFHDNRSDGGEYGFNIDSLENAGVVITRNVISHPQSYGMVIGGIGKFTNFVISDNTITLAPSSMWKVQYGVIFQGNVRGAQVTGNRILSHPSSSIARVFGLYEKDENNTGNFFKDNRISSGMKNSLAGKDCVAGNRSPEGTALKDLPDTSNTRCASAF